MHLDSTVCIVSRDGRALREFDSQLLSGTGLATKRSAKVYVSPGLEYSIVIKNQKACRRLVNVVIDGMAAMTGLVVPAWGTTTLERFQDMPRKFQTALATDGRVTDPLAADLGVVSVSLVDEIQPTTSVPWWQPTYYGGSFGGPTHVLHVDPFLRGHSTICGGLDSLLRGSAVNYCSAQMNSAMPEDKMATVPGDISAQTFSATAWAGSVVGSDIGFSFTLVRQTDAKPGFCSQCGTALHDHAKFCHACGTRA
jgi:hypothetical protein